MAGNDIKDVEQIFAVFKVLQEAAKKAGGLDLSNTLKEAKAQWAGGNDNKAVLILEDKIRPALDVTLANPDRQIAFYKALQEMQKVSANTAPKEIADLLKTVNDLNAAQKPLLKPLPKNATPEETAKRVEDLDKSRKEVEAAQVALEEAKMRQEAISYAFKTFKSPGKAVEQPNAPLVQPDLDAPLDIEKLIAQQTGTFTNVGSFVRHAEQTLAMQAPKNQQHLSAKVEGAGPWAGEAYNRVHDDKFNREFTPKGGAKVMMRTAGEFIGVKNVLLPEDGRTSPYKAPILQAEQFSNVGHHAKAASAIAGVEQGTYNRNENPIVRAEVGRMFITLVERASQFEKNLPIESGKKPVVGQGKSDAKSPGQENTKKSRVEEQRDERLQEQKKALEKQLQIEMENNGMSALDPEKMDAAVTAMLKKSGLKPAAHTQSAASTGPVAPSTPQLAADRGQQGFTRGGNTGGRGGPHTA